MSTGGWSGSPGPWGPPGSPPSGAPHGAPPQRGQPYPGAGHGPYGGYGPYGSAPPTPGHPWGPPAGPPGPGAPGPGRRSSTRGGRIALVVVLAVLLVGLVVVALLAFVVGPRFARVDVLDPAAVERGVSDVVTQDWRRTVTGVDCPAEVRVRAGESFRCTATVDGRPRQVPVDVLDDRGTYQVGQPR